MANTPTPKSYDQILGDMIQSYMSKIGVNDLNTGSAVTSFFEAMAQTVYRSTGDTFSIMRDFSVDRATGEALKRIAAEENVKLETAKVATGYVDISDISFAKISTKVYAGSIAPNIGSSVIKVSDASSFFSSGQIYIGRGTGNIEGPISYSSKTQVGGYWELNLSSPTTKFHNISESVLLAQGGIRNITSGTIVKSPASGGSADILFKTTQSYVILDGDNAIANVAISADSPGSDSNVTRGGISLFGSNPFIGAKVYNSSPLTTGKNEESDDEIRDKIKRTRGAKGLGTTVAVKNATLGAQSTSENTRVISNEMFADADSATLFIDNGEGYEPKTSGTGLEYLIDSALGGETRFQLVTGGSQTSIAKAFLESSFNAPYSVQTNDRLAILVGGVLNEHVFSSGNFRSEGYATAYEIASSVNSNPLLTFVARTSSGGQRITIESKSELNEFLQITTPSTGGDAGVALGLSSSEVQTLRLYKNRTALSRNGNTASLTSANQSDWSSTLLSGETLVLSVDGTSAIAYTLTNSDFLSEGSYSTLSKSNSLQSWVNVINNKVTGASASINGNRITLSSNLGSNSRAKIVIDSASTLVTKGMFTTVLGLTSTGSKVDFTLSRNTAQLKLTNPLEIGDSLTAGTELNKASISSTPILGGNLTLATEANLWFSIDQSDSAIISSGVVSDTLLSISKPFTNVIRYTSNITTAFANVQVGDYMIVWSGEIDSNNRLEGRVNSVTNTYVDLKVTANESAGAVAQPLIVFKEGMVFLRGEKTPQKISITAGSYDINAISTLIQDSLVGVQSLTENDEIITINSKTNDIYGSILVVTFNDVAKNLNLTAGMSGKSIVSHFASYETVSSDADYPLFVHSLITSDRDLTALPITDLASSTLLLSENIVPNEIITLLDPFLTGGVNINDAQASKESIQINSIVGNTVNIDSSKFLRRLRTNDRYFVAGSFNFDFNDSLIVVLDENPINKIFPIPLYRKAKANITKGIDSTNFRAYDTDSGATAQFSTNFGSTYSFKNYKVLMQAKNVIDPITLINEDAVLFRAASWGLAGEKIRVTYGYPTSANQSITSTVVVDSNVSIRINLKSSALVSNAIDSTTEWNTAITPNTPVTGVDQVSYTWSTVGTAPAIGALVAGNYVAINANGEFNVANQGVFRISSATATSFTVSRPNGIAVTESNIATAQTNTISLYANNDTTASEITSYVNTTLSNFITATLLNDSGTLGAGILSKSTYESNNFSSEYVSLVDGINYLADSALSVSAPTTQFSFKNPLVLPSYSTNTVNSYAFNNGENIRFIPTTAKQISEFISTLAVSGVTTLGGVSTSSRNGKLQINSSILGSKGAVQVTGGTGNSTTALVINQSTVIPNTSLLKSSINKSSATGFQVGQFVKLTTTNTQKKETGISATTNVTIHPNTILAFKSVLELSNKETQDRYFGQPRSAIKDIGRAFYVEKHGKLVCISWDYITGSDPYFSKTVEINTDGGNISVGFDSTLGITSYTAVTGTRNFSEVQIGDTVVIAAMVDANNNGTFKILGVSSNKKTIATTNSTGVTAASTALLAVNLVITTSIEEGDSVKIGAPFASLNQGTFRLIRKYNNSFYIDNPSAYPERIIGAENTRSLGFDATTQFDVTVPGNMRLTWDVTGTQPTLENAKLGDTLIIGTAFAANNQGSFMVTKSNKPMQEMFNFTVPSGAELLGSQRIHFELPNSGTKYYGWFNLNGVSTDPAPSGRTGVPFVYTGAESSSAIGTIVQTAINALANITATVVNNIVSVVFDQNGSAVDAENIDVLNGSLLVTQHGSLSFVECANAKAITESNITVTSVGGNVLKSHNPSLLFSPYDNTSVGDSITISGTVLSASNSGTYVISEVLDQERVVINSLMTIQNNTSLAAFYANIYVTEELPYVGFKKIYNLVVDPASASKSIIIFDTNSQYSKINDIGVVSIDALAKLEFNSTNKRGLDSYRYHTGLIAEVNKIIYGDPRDNITYPGVAAAGAEIFIEPPLFRKIEISINVRLKTGIPFARITEQVRSNISALVNSTAIGQSISISSIISATNSVSGVTAVSITSPNYSPTSDIIAVAANEKPIILNATQDILVAKVV